MSKITTPVIEHGTQIDFAIAGSTKLRLDASGVSRPNGKDAQWYTDLIGSNFAIGGDGALAEAALSIGSFRKYNAWELINDAVLNPYLDVNFWLPPDYDASALKVTLYLVKTATATGTDIVTTVRLGCADAADTLDLAISSPVNITDTVGADNALFIAEHTLTPANAVSGVCHGIIQRRPTEVADDYTGSVFLVGARVEYS